MRAAALSGPKAGMPTAASAAHHAQRQRVILRHDHIIKLFLSGKGHHGLYVRSLDVLAFWHHS